MNWFEIVGAGMVVTAAVVIAAGTVIEGRKRERIEIENERRSDVAAALWSEHEPVKVRIDEDGLYTRFENEDGVVLIFFANGDHQVIPPLRHAGVRVVRGPR
jgi:hypothetical protein